jgi:hypothetical protein
MAGIIGRLERTCTREFAIITVGLGQTELANRLSGGARSSDEVLEPAPSLTPGTPSNETPADLARHVVETFLATRRHPGGFALDPRSGEFISPHLYLAARAYLHGVGDG